MNTFTLGSSVNDTLHVTGQGGVDVMSLTGGTLNIDLTSSSGYNTISILNQSSSAFGMDTVHVDFTGHDVVTGSTSSNWTDVLDLSAAHNSSTQTSLYIDIQNAAGSWTETVVVLTNGTVAHGTAVSGSNLTGEIFTDAAHTHALVDFSHVEKIVY
jgi:hypothetical protein